MDTPLQKMADSKDRGSKGSLDLEAELLALWRRLLKSEAVTVDHDFCQRW
jgi:hypothetical protein